MAKSNVQWIPISGRVGITVVMIAVAVSVDLLTHADDHSIASAQTYSWSRVSSGTSSNLLATFALDAQNAWVVGEDGTVLNASRSWHQWDHVDTLDADYTQRFNAVHFVSPSSGWVGGARSIHRTSNGGRTWSSAHFNEQYADSRQALYALSSTTVWQAGMENRCNPCFPMLTRMMFGPGSTTTYTHYLIRHEMHSISALDFVDEDNGWAAGSLVLRDRDPSGIVVRISNASGEPEYATTSLDVRLRSIAMIDSRRGWVVGDGGSLMSTSDGGESWTQADVTVAADLADVVFPNADFGCAVGSGGTILATDDGGLTWSAEMSGVTDDLVSVHCTETHRCIAVGDNGSIFVREPPTPTRTPTREPSATRTRTPSPTPVPLIRLPYVAKGDVLIPTSTPTPMPIAAGLWSGSGEDLLFNLSFVVTADRRICDFSMNWGSGMASCILNVNYCFPIAPGNVLQKPRRISESESNFWGTFMTDSTISGSWSSGDFCVRGGGSWHGALVRSTARSIVDTHPSKIVDTRSSKAE